MKPYYQEGIYWEEIKKMTEEEIRLDERQKIQKYIDENNIYQVEFGHYDFSSDNPYYWWIPLKTYRINLEEVFNETKSLS